MGKPFEIVLQRVQGTGSVLSLERSLDQSICKSRIFGQDRAMAVGTESIFVPHTFGPVLSVISITFDDLPQRADTCSQKGAPAVVFKAHDRAAPGFLSQPESIVSDHAFLPSDRVKQARLPQQSAMRLFLTFFVLFPPEKPKKSGKDSESISHGAFAAFNHHPINYCPL
jgi:hypothetical protein